jgi:formate/nitrite transporter FocA (FNT family)
MNKKKQDSRLTGQEASEAVRRAAPRAAVVFEAIRLEAVEELARRSSALFWSGIAAGLSMGFSFIAEALLHAALPDAAWRPLISKLGYSVGFMIVILGRQQLFTENTLTPVIQVLREHRLAVLLDALRLWGVVLVANVLGTGLFGAALYGADVFGPAQTDALRAIAMESVSGEFRQTFISAILAGWLIALMVWLLPVAESARVAVVVIITWLVGLGGFSHIIAGSTLASYALAAGIATPGMVFGNFFLPTLAGNILGGVAFVAALNYAQVVPDE